MLGILIKGIFQQIIFDLRKYQGKLFESILNFLHSLGLTKRLKKEIDNFLAFSQYKFSVK